MSDQSPARICNLALAACGHSEQIVDLAAESTTARLCAMFLDEARRAVLCCGHPWTFATTSQALTLNATTPPAPWRYAYAMPEGVVKPLHLVDDRLQRLPEERYPFAVEPTADGNALQIFTMNADASLRYVRDQANYGVWTPKARLALAAELAVHLVGPLKGKLEQQRYLREVAEGKLAEAMIDDDQRRADGPNIPSRYEAARG